MAHKLSYKLRAVIAILAMFLMVAVPASAFAQTEQQQKASAVSGNAFGISAEGVVDIDPTPEVTLPATGGDESDTVARINQSGITTAVLTVSTSGDLVDGTSTATATVNELAVTVAGAPNQVVTATTLEATSDSFCDEEGNPQSEGSSIVEDLMILGQEIEVTGEPNQRVRVELPGGAGSVEVVINEQIGGDGDLTVNALHITVTLGGVTQDIVVAHAKSDITCTDDMPDTGGAPEAPLFPMASLASAIVVVGFGTIMLRRMAQSR